jgi:hypothetical protein
MISFRTFGTSAKKKSAKMPAEAPKAAAILPLFGVRVSRFVRSHGANRHREFVILNGDVLAQKFCARLLVLNGNCGRCGG